MMICCLWKFLFELFAYVLILHVWLAMQHKFDTMEIITKFASLTILQIQIWGEVWYSVVKSTLLDKLHRLIRNAISEIRQVQKQAWCLHKVLVLYILVLFVEDKVQIKISHHLLQIIFIKGMLSNYGTSFTSYFLSENFFLFTILKNYRKPQEINNLCIWSFQLLNNNNQLIVSTMTQGT